MAPAMPTTTALATKKRQLVGFRWGRGDDLVLFKTNIRGRATKEQEPTQAVLDPATEPNATKIVTVSFDQVPNHLRPLIFEGRRCFVELQQVVLPNEAMMGRGSEESEQEQDEKTLAGRAAILNSSKHLRGKLDECIEQLDVCSAMDDDLEAFSRNQKMASALWHLCEILVLDSGALVVNALAAWTRQHFPRFGSKREELECIMAAQQSQSEDTAFMMVFWRAIDNFVLRGDLLSAWTLLSRHLEFERAARKIQTKAATRTDEDIMVLYADVRRLMLAMPRFEADPGAPPELVEGLEWSSDDVSEWMQAAMDPGLEMDFKERWTQWHEVLRQFLKEKGGALSQLDSNLVDMLKIMQGDIVKIMDKLKGDFDFWPHLLTGCLLFHVPTSHKGDLGSLAEQCMAWKQSTAELDGVAMSVFTGDMVAFVQGLHREIGDRWVGAHLVELLARARLLDTVSVNPAELQRSSLFSESDFLLGDLELDLREYFVLEYALQVGLGGRQARRNAPFAGNWRVAADYLVALNRHIRVPQQQRQQGSDGPGFLLVPLGLLAMQLVVDYQAPISERFCERLVRGCEEMGLSAESIIRERVMYWWCFRGGRQKYLSDDLNAPTAVSLVGCSNALRWAARSSEAGGANRLLQVLFKFSSLETLDVLVEHVGSSVGAGSSLDDSNAMHFLQKYHVLHTNLRDASNILSAAPSRSPGSPSTAAAAQAATEEALVHRDLAVKQLSDILAAGLVPQRFFLALLRKVLLWERHNDAIMASGPCMDLMQAKVLLNSLEQISVSHNRKRYLGGMDDQELCLLRLAIVQSLARAPVIMKRTAR